MERFVRRSALRLLMACGLAVGSMFLLIMLASAAQDGSTPPTALHVAPTADGALRDDIPLAASATITNFADQPMCRFGYAAILNPIGSYNPTDIASLRAGWYHGFGTDAAPARPNGMEFAQLLQVKQRKTVEPSYTATYAIPYTYTVEPSLAALPSLVASVPGSLWMVGNEIDRRDWECGGGYTCSQNEILPEVYADAYYVVYNTIKAADPTARVAIGGVVEVTPLRLKYLDRILAAYQAKYGTMMPVDVWNVHIYMLDEVRNGFGADIPAGLSETVGARYTDSQNDDINAFQQQVLSFRQWMATKGEQHKPLVISEFGVNLPTWYVDGSGNPYSLARVRNYMYAAFDYLLTATSPTLGMPADDNRLVQAWNWFSLDYYPAKFNGNLFDYTTRNIAQLGLDWRAYVNNTSKPFGPALNLKMLVADYSLSARDSLGKVTATVKLQMSNSGFLNWSGPVTVLVSKTDGTPLAQTTINSFPGCGRTVNTQLLLPNLDASVLLLRAQVDPTQQTPDANFGDNTQNFTLLTDPIRTFLPLIRR